jgi:hypothetical protein
LVLLLHELYDYTNFKYLGYNIECMTLTADARGAERVIDFGDLVHKIQAYEDSPVRPFLNGVRLAPENYKVEYKGTSDEQLTVGKDNIPAEGWLVRGSTEEWRGIPLTNRAVAFSIIDEVRQDESNPSSVTVVSSEYFVRRERV